jgi:sulfate/thiosulfate-binding protein
MSQIAPQGPLPMNRLPLSRRQFAGRLGAGLVSTGLLGVVGCSPASSTSGAGQAGAAPGTALELLNVSYDPTRELWKEINAAFLKEYVAANPSQPLSFRQSHGGSGSQARAVIDGLEADVATLSLWPDTDAIRKAGLINAGWEERLPNRSLPYTSLVVFVVRKGNPKGIQDWPDLVKEGVEVITPSPKTSGNGRMTLLTAWGYLQAQGKSDDESRAFLKSLYANVPTLDSGARGATATFAQKGIGDVHVTMESEAYLEVEESKGELEIVYPSVSFLHEPHITIVDKVVDKKGTRAIAEAYLKFLYTPAGQAIIAKHYFRPIDPEAAKAAEGKLKSIAGLTLIDITKVAKDWDDAQKKFFDDGGVFDSIYAPKS